MNHFNFQRGLMRMPLNVIYGGVLIVLASTWLSAATVDPVQVIIDDMTLPPDAAFHGTEAMDWGTGAAGTPTSVPHQNWKGEWFEAMTNWGQVYIPRAGSPATNTRCQIRNLTSKLLRKNGTWETVQSGGPQGAAFREDFKNNEAINPDVRDESANGGGLSMIVGVGQWAGFNYHFWNTGSRAVVDVNNTVAVYTACEARLIISNPSLPDDRATCKNILQMGADWWLNQSGGWLPDWSANGGICGGRAKWVTSEWQTFTMCTLTPTQIRANPPVVAVNPPPNQAPTVALTAPSGGSSVVAGANLVLSATASDSDGSVTSVDFLQGTSVIGTDFNGADGWSFTVSSITAGTYQFSARAMDNSGAQVTSVSVQVTVTPPVVVPSLVASAIGTTTNGSLTISDSSLTVTGSGRDIWGTSDGFEFASRTLAGDGQIVVRVASQSVTDPWAKAGIMMREGMAANAPFVFAAVTPANGIAFQRRLTTGASCAHTSGAKVQAPYWLKLVRLGNRFTTSQSVDGVTWRQIGAVTVTMTSTIQIGLAVTSHRDGTLSTAVFDHLTITGMGAAGG